jgi:GH18 family chitinase
VGGWNLSGGFVPMTFNAKARAAFVRNLTTYVRAHRLQGADVDWEHPKGAAQIANYQKLLIELKRAFAPHRLWLTVAVPGWGDHIQSATFPFIDRIHVMAYDQGTPHAPFAGAVKELRHWESRKAPKTKLVLGLPFYGRNAQDATATYAEIIRKHRPKPGADEAGGFHFNGPATIRRKTIFALQQGYAGVMIWELGQDVAGKSSLLNVIRDALPK